MGTLLVLDPAQIIPPPVYLRPVLEDSIEFMELVDSLKRHGQLNSILVRPTPDDGIYQLVDGAWRLAAARRAKLTIDATCQDIPDDEVYEKQIAANAIGKITEPVEFARHIERLRRSGESEMSLATLSVKIKKTPTWISNMLGLLKLNRNIQAAVNDGLVPLGSAYVLARLTPRLQVQLFNEAKVKKVAEFKRIAAAVSNNYQVAVKTGRVQEALDTRAQILAGKAIAHQRGLVDVENEIRSHTVGAAIILEEGCQSAIDGFYAGLKWTLHLDEKSRRERIADEKSKDETVERNRLRRKEEREALRKCTEDLDNDGNPD